MARECIEPGPGQESVWDYPRPPLIEPTPRRLRVEFGGKLIADTVKAYRVCETSHPPGYYIPPDDIDMACLEASHRRSFCEWKGQADYWTVRVGDKMARDAAWSYPKPTSRFASIRDFISFYPQMMDACYVDEERVVAQAGDFYGGWRTSDIVGPFKGEPGTEFW